MSFATNKKSMMSFASNEAKWRDRLTSLNDFLTWKFSGSEEVYIKESDSEIDNAGQEWDLITISFDKNKILSCLKPVSLAVDELYRFDKNKKNIMEEVCYLFGLPGEKGLKEMKKSSVVNAKILNPPNLNDEIIKLLNDEEIMKALELKDKTNNKFKHLVFLLYLKRRRDELMAAIEDPGATENKRAVFLAQLWLEIDKSHINDGIFFLMNGYSGAKNIIDRESLKNIKEQKRFVCPHCKKEFSEINMASHRLSIEGIIAEYCLADHISMSRNGIISYICPLCKMPLNGNELDDGLYDASKQWCFVASAVFTQQSDEVKILREIRDRWLSNIAGGKTFIKIYYKYGPFIAGIVTRVDILRRLVKKILRFIIDLWIKKRNAECEGNSKDA